MATYYTNEIVKKTNADSYTDSDEHFIVTDKVLVDREGEKKEREREREREYKKLKIKSQKGAMSNCSVVMVVILSPALCGTEQCTSCQSSTEEYKK